jgi:hypothetical protein
MAEPPHAHSSPKVLHQQLLSSLCPHPYNLSIVILTSGEVGIVARHTCTPANMALVALYNTVKLPQGKRSIRVVRLNDQSPLNWESNSKLRVVDFDATSVDYTALSYMWGDPKQTASVLIDNYPMEITRNLCVFLSEMQWQHRCEWFWIDALCL